MKDSAQHYLTSYVNISGVDWSSFWYKAIQHTKDEAESRKSEQ